jgi:hypothetical protein
MRDLELAPLHSALQQDRAADAVREAAALVGGKAPGRVRAARSVDAVEEFLARERPDLSRGRWLYEWRIDRVVPDVDLAALRLDRDGRASLEPRKLLRDERFRRAIGVNEHDEETWFNRERFEHAIDVLGLPRSAELRRAAEKSGYRLDEFERALTIPPVGRTTMPTGATKRSRQGGKTQTIRKTARPREPRTRD